MSGGCYQFYLFLKVIFPQALPFINKNKDHIISKINREFFDISGIVNQSGFEALTYKDLDLVKTWSFSKYSALSLGECAFCEEPILI